MQKEIWKDVVGYEGLYKVSDMGRVFSIRRNKILSPGLITTGYHNVILQKKGDRKAGLVHRIVALAFLPNTKNCPQVNHLNGCKTDNNLSNLEWVTCKQNMRHAMRTGLWNPVLVSDVKVKSNAINIKKANKSTCRPVINIDTGDIYKSAADASRAMNLHKTRVSKAVKSGGTAKGFYWKYINEQ